jgi:hypothetical protein
MRLVSSLLILAVSVLPTSCRAHSAPAAAEAVPLPAATADPGGPRATALADFSRAVDAYVAMHREAQATVPALRAGASAAEVAGREHALAQAIIRRRASAKVGDIFTPTVKPLLVGIVRGYLSAPDAAPGKDSVAKENPQVETPTFPVNLKVNAPYDGQASFSTVPSPLLLKLPSLPRELEFRFVGKHLVLRDTTANTIVDYILHVVP